jgi:hypothetical protein
VLCCGVIAEFWRGVSAGFWKMRAEFRSFGAELWGSGAGFLEGGC